MRSGVLRGSGGCSFVGPQEVCYGRAGDTPRVRGLGCDSVNRVVYFLCWVGRSGLMRMSGRFLAPRMWFIEMIRLLMWSCR